MSTQFSRSKVAGVLLVCVGVAGGVILTSSLDFTKYGWAQSRPAVSQIPAARNGPMAPAEVGSFANVAERVTPSVVAINTIRDARQVPGRGGRGRPQVPQGMEEFMQQFGGQMPQQQMQREMRGEGSGFIVTPDGYIITNNHVVEDADHVKVTLSDSRTFDAKVVGRDSTTDVAVVKIDAKGLSPLPIGNDETARIGDWVLAVGNPLGLDFTVTAGIISAKSRGGREVQLPNAGQLSISDFIQTDAAINPGNSGGPLINLKGEAIGLNSAIASETGYYSGYGFAIPITLVKQVADALIKEGRVHLPMMGVSVSPLNANDAGANGLTVNGGVLVNGYTDSPAQPARDAGIQPGDVIVAIAGQPVNRVSSLQRIVRSHAVGESIPVEVVRFGAKKSFKVKLAEVMDGARPAASVAPAAFAAPTPKTLGKFGIAVQSVPPELAKRLDVAAGTGVLVSDVAPTSPAREYLTTGDVITDVLNPGPRRSIKSADDLQSTLASLKTGEYLSLSVKNAQLGSQARVVNIRAN